MPTIAPFELSGHCIAAAYLWDSPFFALADGTVHRLDHGAHSSNPHDGLLCAARTPAGDQLITGGEDGKVTATDRSGATTVLAEYPGKWITCVAAGPQGAVAFATGRAAMVRKSDGTLVEFQEQRTVEGLAFAPKGMRIAAARYNGVSLHWAGLQTEPVDLDWKGAHTLVTFSPDGKYLVSSMQENALHGWRLKDGKHMRMSGYPAKVKSLSWSAKGKWLASSGAPAAIVWPFSGKDGPMGKAPLELGTRGDTTVTCVACHPTDDAVAIGYGDGMITVARISDGKEAVLRRGGRGAVSTMGWSRRGVQLVFGTETGDCGVADLTA
ncbi:WD40 repeat domain-containing protein [Hoeflea prorocentri]|uniref:WD40 repeat domain-containing protein n=1 Tax=Hoeflea prorocentri TaxID=1922333 RepID=A0A9X3UEI7_9HYPH|nr:WD40 repeat domain-containing protein [Hoeflea prorocentri]MCY6379193.1 WD40 repeat domain-containing protein [Hoeflea prorocentri]MDA5396994.1 WD40 repeat domain-containing protein [Hoeflea prorocentri]